MKALTIGQIKTARQQGFTIIELVVVILLLGILTATALPRFMDISDEAHEAVVDAVEGGLNVGMALFRAEFIAQGGTTSTVTGYAATASVGSGYPLTNDTSSCDLAYDGILQVGHPTIAEGSSVASSPALATTTHTIATDFVTYHMSGDDSCVFVYAADVDPTPVAATGWPSGTKIIQLTSGGVITQSTL